VIGKNNLFFGKMTKARKIFRLIGIGIVCLIFVVLSSALLYRKYLQHKVAERRAIYSPHGIDSLEQVQIGGIDQWIEVRGQNVDNPILLWIHGGPGIAFIPLAGDFQGPWEKYFTVVQWDQRGAGKTYASNDKERQRRTMNLTQMQQDTVNVVKYLCGRFHRQKIFVVGHSWGSVLGLWLAHEHPELIYAYVGTGQAVNMRQNEETAYQDALQAARSQHNALAVKELESIAPYPPARWDGDHMGVAKKWEQELLGVLPSGAVFLDTRRLLTDLVSAPEYSLVDDYRWLEAQSFSEALVPELMQVDLTQLGPVFQVPIFFFEGRHDEYCPPSLVWEYYQTVKAPQKEFVWFENSGHFPFFEERQKFADELIQRVLSVQPVSKIGL
jgi:pimeloyl-ACP methyl ester carboxylesterase